MKKRKLSLGLLFGAVLLTTSLLVVQKANALQDSNKKQLQTCSVQDGDTITQIGNTCTSGGKGCTANPCGN